MKRAFTLLELIIVIVVIGVLAAVIFPRIGTDNLEKAALTVVDAVRYAQHLAMVDDKFDPKDQNWYKRKWQVFFTKSSGSQNAWSIIVFSDKFGATGRPDPSEIAPNPLDPSKKLTGGYTSGASGIRYEDPRATKRFNIGKTYGIQDISFSNCGSRAKRISFDELGRPYSGDQSTTTKPYQRKITRQCVITLCKQQCSAASNSEKISVVINPETGYTFIRRY